MRVRASGPRACRELESWDARESVGAPGVQGVRVVGCASERRGPGRAGPEYQPRQFSALSKLILATKYTFCSIVQYLQKILAEFSRFRICPYAHFTNAFRQSYEDV